MKKPVKKVAAPRAAKKIVTVAKLYGRCLELGVGKDIIEIKVMGPRDDAAESREKLITAFAAMGVEFLEGDAFASGTGREDE